MACSYTFNGESNISYQDLINMLTDSEIDAALSILFKLSQDDVYDLILALKKEFKFKQWEKSNYNSIDGEPSIEAGDSMSIQQFIDSHYFTVNGEPPMFKMVFDDYLKYKKADLVDNKHMSENEAEMYVNLMKLRWETIAQDAFDLHKLLVSTKGKNDVLTYQELSTSTIGTSFQAITDRVENAASQVIKLVFLRNGSDKIGGGAKGRLIKNVNLSAKINGIDEEIVGHIDYLIIRENGDIEVFNIKSSTESYSNWDSVKKEKYRYQMALIKRILEYNGISTKNIRMNIIPVKMTYDANFETITDLDVEPTVSMDFKDNEYILRKYDKVAEYFVDSSVTLEEIDNDVIIKLSNQLLKIFPGRDIKAKGIEETAKTWLEKHWNLLLPTPHDEGGWQITIPGDENPILIDDPTYGTNNKELLGIIQDRLDDLSNNILDDKSIYRVISDIRNAYERQGFYNPPGREGRYFYELFKKYFEHTVNKDGTFTYTWELQNNDLLTESGILIFTNRKTGQVDVVTLTTYDVTTKYQFKGRNHLLGYYLPNMNEEGFTMESNYGNIEAIRTMVILNEILPHLVGGKTVLGELKVLGISHQIHGKKGVLFDLSRLAPQFDTIIKVVNKNTNSNIVNNFKEQGFKYVDAVDILIQQWNEIISSPSNESLSEIKSLDEYITHKHLIDGTTIDGLVQIETTEAKIEKLEMLIDKLRSLAEERGIKIGNIPQLLEISRGTHNDLSTAIAKLYLTATKALNLYYGDLSLENEDFGAIEEYMLKNNSITNSNIRQIGFMFQRSIDKIANDMVTRYSPIREIFMKFYEEAGYTKTQNALIGNLASVYTNLYELDLNGNRTMQFKNPYDEFNNLKPYEREFLKKILYEFHKVRCEVIGLKNDIKGPDDPKLKPGSMPPKYLNAPLEKASDATRRVQIDQGILQWGKRVVRKITKPKEFFEEMQGLIGAEEISKREEDIKNLQAYNPFTNSEASENVRNSYLKDKGIAYFEYNVENLFIDYLEKHIQSIEYTKLLTRAKGIELDLILRGETEEDEKGIEHTLKVINDFLSINVFNKSIISEDFQKVEAFIAPLRSAVSSLYIAGNVAGAVRDGFQGLLENISSAVIKFQTSIDAKDVAFGYKEVIAEGVNNLMTMSKLNQFNVKYRFSNLDVARISEGQKTGRGGILNAENWAYSTLRGPDYLNRMVLFVAKMNHDGCYDAYKLNKENRLEYDWRKDKRFSLYAKKEEGKRENLEEYNKQKALYYSLIRAFNMEGYKKDNGEQLNYSDDLPDAYTLLEILSFKTFSDNIYGSYNKSTKAKYEHTAIGRNFAFFSTWMNGIVDVYMKKTQVTQGESKLQQEVDYNGNLLFFTEDGTITTENTGIPVMKGVPMMVQGIFATLQDIAKTFYHCGMDENGQWSASKGWKSVKTDIWTNEIARRNMRRLLRDILIGGILSALFKMWISKEYQQHKTNSDGQNILANACIELLYKSSSSCFDTFLGPMAMLDYLGNQTNPATYKLQSKIFKDVWNLAIGEKTMGQVIMGSQALPRSFLDTYKMWVRDTQS